MEEKKQTGEEQAQIPKNGTAMTWIVVAVIIVVIGIVYYSRGKNKLAYPAAMTPSSRTNIATPPVTDNSAIKTFDISAKPFEFSVKEIRVKKGDKVRINLTVTQGMHDWVVDEFNAKTDIIQTGKSASVEFTADKTGTFEYYCSVPTHRQQGMVGKLIVE